MPNFVALWTMIRSLGPVFYLMAAAFKYGCMKYGDGSWKTLSSGEHLDLALHNIVQWKLGGVDKPFLVDAALRVAFAVAQAIAQKTTPAEYKK